MTDIQIHLQPGLNLGSSRASVASTADQAHFAQLLEGMRSVSRQSSPPAESTSAPLTPRGGLGSELFKDIHGLDQIMDGMAVASKLNSKEIQGNGDHMTRLAETILRLEVDGDTYFMQTNYASQRASEFGDELNSLMRNK
jgi:hypothetical protein